MRRVNITVGVKNVGELPACIKVYPDEVSDGAAGAGDAGHPAGVLFGMLTDTKLTHVPYKGRAPMMTDLAGAWIQMVIETRASAYPQVKASGATAGRAAPRRAWISFVGP